MECHQNRRRDNRENLFSFGDLRNEKMESFERTSTRVHTQPQPRYSNSSKCNNREALAPRNTNMLTVNDQRTPSFNFNSDVDRPAMYEPPKYPCQNRLTHHGSHRRFNPPPSYFYDPSIEDITKKYGIRLKSGRQDLAGRLPTEAPVLRSAQPAPSMYSRSFSQAKLPKKASRLPTRNCDDSFEMQLANRFNKREQLIKQDHFYLKATPCSYNSPSLHQTPDSPPVSTQDTIDSINDLDMRINAKVNRILCDEYSYY